MATKISDREFALRLLDKREGRPNVIKAKKIAEKLGVRIRERLMESI